MNNETETKKYVTNLRVNVDLDAEVTPPPPDGFAVALDSLVATIEDSDDLASLIKSPAQVEFRGGTYSVEFSANGAVDQVREFSLEH